MTASAPRTRRNGNTKTARYALYHDRLREVVKAFDAASAAIRALLELEADGFVDASPTPPDNDDANYMDARSVWRDCQGAEWAIGIARDSITTACNLFSEPKRDELGRSLVTWPGLGGFWLRREPYEVVRLLLAAMLNHRSPDVHEKRLLLEVETDAKTLGEMFVGSGAWGVLIVPGKKPKTYRLAPLPGVEEAVA
jgi:hypothetical protein